MEMDSVIMGLFCDYLAAGGYNRKYIAVLSEDETAFGAATPIQTPLADKNACPGAVQLYYPRDIATLRSAYENQSIFSASKPQSNAASPTTTLRGDLSEPANSDHDTVRSYGGQLTPQAQEAVLLDITNRLDANQIQFIILRSTSSLDQIFLSEFLRRSYPGGRVVIDGADLLFTRGAEGRSLRGVMLLSSYPLLITKDTSRGRTFAEDFSQADYIAALGLFRDPDANQSGVSPNENRPVWLTVIGRRQFWPLAALNASDLTRFPVPVSMWLFLIAFVFFGAGHSYFCWSGSVLGSPRARAYFAPLPLPQHPALIAFGSMLIGMLAVSVAANSGLFWYIIGRNPFETAGTGIVLAIALLLAVGAVLVAWERNYRLEPLCASTVDKGERKMGPWQVRTTLAAVSVFILFVLVRVYLISRLTSKNAVSVYLRSVNLSSGVSPLLPQVLLIAGAYLWFWCTLRGLAHFGDDRPLLPKRKDLLMDGAKSMMPMFSREEAGDPIEKAARPLTKSYVAGLVVICGIAFFVCLVALPGLWLRTLGELDFGILILVSLCLCVGVILTDSLEMWVAWSELRKLLVYLDRLPLRRTLRALKGLAWGSIWKMSGNVLEERYRVISLQLESFKHLTNTVQNWMPSDPSAAKNRADLLQAIDNCESKSKDFVKWFVALKPGQPIDLECLREFQVALASTAGSAMTNVLVPAWRKETDSLIFSSSRMLEGGEGGAEASLPTQDLACHVRAAEEFFVLPYLGFIQNILGRIRTIALGSLWLFLGATLAISSYPFDPLSVLGGIFLTVFVIYGGLAVLVYSQMARDATLSHVTNTRPGELGWEFWQRLAAFGVGPLIGLLTTLFPSITDFVFSWLQPSTQALK
jgi:hypothetical protein